MTARRRLLVGAAALAVAAGAGCADGGGDAGDEATAASEAEALVGRLTCDRTPEPDGSGDERGWLVRDVRDCEMDRSGTTVRVYASLTEAEHAAAVRLLSMDAGGQPPGPMGEPCRASEGEGAVGVVAGDTWVAVVPGDPAPVAAALDGEVLANRVTPPVSTAAMSCFPP